MKHLSIYWTNDPDELLKMIHDLGDPGITVGNEGCEIAVTDAEHAEITEYTERHPYLTVEVYGDISRAEAASLAESA